MSAPVMKHNNSYPSGHCQIPIKGDGCSLSGRVGFSVMEIWKDIEGYKGYYQISNLGRVKSLPKRWKGGKHNGKILKSWSGTIGYETVELKDKPFLVHRLVGIAFIPNPENKSEINHKDGIKFHNYVDNLEWCTRSENLLHAYRVLKRPSLTGTKNHFSKLTESQVIMIRMYDESGESSTKIAETYGIHYSTVRLIIKRKTWKHI